MIFSWRLAVKSSRWGYRITYVRLNANIILPLLANILRTESRKLVKPFGMMRGFSNFMRMVLTLNVWSLAVFWSRLWGLPVEESTIKRCLCQIKIKGLNLFVFLQFHGNICQWFGIATSELSFGSDQRGTVCADSWLRAVMSEWKNVPSNWGRGDPCDDKWVGIGCTGSHVTSM